MSRYSKTGKLAKCGSMDSKYFGNTDQFEKDIQDRIEKTEQFKETLKELILKEPSLIETRVRNTIDVLLEIKKDYNV
jgi:hypothetical protein